MSSTRKKSADAPRRTLFVTAVSIASILSLGPAIWFVASFVAPSLLPQPASRQMVLIPMHERSLPLPSSPTAAPADAALAHGQAPEPIAARWHVGRDGSIDLPMEQESRRIHAYNQERNQP